MGSIPARGTKHGPDPRFYFAGAVRRGAKSRFTLVFERKVRHVFSLPGANSACGCRHVFQLAGGKSAEIRDFSRPGNLETATARNWPSDRRAHGTEHRRPAWYLPLRLQAAWRGSSRLPTHTAHEIRQPAADETGWRHERARGVRVAGALHRSAAAMLRN